MTNPSQLLWGFHLACSNGYLEWAIDVPEPDQVPALDDDQSKQDRDGFANFQRATLVH